MLGNSTLVQVQRWFAIISLQHPTGLTATLAGNSGPPDGHLVMTFDGGTVIPVEWQEVYVADVTALGATVTTKSYPNDDHFSLPTSCVADARQWLTSLL